MYLSATKLCDSDQGELRMVVTDQSQEYSFHCIYVLQINLVVE